MNILELKKCMSQGREIELSLNKHKYFLQPDFEDANNIYIIYDCTNSNCITEVFAGSIEEITNYLFDGEYSLNNNLSKFIFSYIL